MGNQGHALVLGESIHGLRRSVAEALLLVCMNWWGEVCGGGSPSVCSDLKHDRKNTCQEPCEIELLTLVAWWWPLVWLENRVVLGPCVWEKPRSSLMSRDMPSFLVCDLKLWSLKCRLKRRGFHGQMDDGRRKLCRPYLFRIPYLSTALHVKRQLHLIRTENKP